MTLINENHYYIHLLNLILEHHELKNKHFNHVDFTQYKNTSDFNLKRLKSDISHTTFRSWLFCLKHVSKYDGRKIISDIQEPILIIEGEKDKVCNIKEAKKIEKLTSNGKLSIIQNENHIVVVNDPKDICNEIMKFLTNNKLIIMAL